MLVAGCRSEALAYGPAVLLPIIALWAWQIVKARFSALPAVLTVALLGGIIVGTYSHGLFGGWRVPSYACNYNRFQWALISLLSLICLVEPRSALPFRRRLLEGASAGVLVGLLLLGKVNYAGAAILIFAAAGLVRRQERDRRYSWLGALAALAAVLGLGLVRAHGDVGSYWSDLRF